MRRPKLHKYQYPPQAHNEAPFEFGSTSGGGLLTLTNTGEKLIVDLFQLDPTVEVRVPSANLARLQPDAGELDKLIGNVSEALREWETATQGDSNDAEHEAGIDLAEEASRLVEYLRSTTNPSRETPC